MLTIVDKVVLYRATSASRSVVADVEHNTDALTSRIQQSAVMALIFRYVIINNNKIQHVYIAIFTECTMAMYIVSIII